MVMRGFLALPVVLVCLGGCAGLADPFQRQGTWQATGVNADNLRAMVANPADLRQGRGAPDTNGLEAAAAVTRLRDDKLKRLPGSGLSNIGGSSGSGGQGGGGQDVGGQGGGVAQ
jgi:hypothetical protein